MKTAEIREMSAAELDNKLAGLKEELFNLRFLPVSKPFSASVN